MKDKSIDELAQLYVDRRTKILDERLTIDHLDRNQLVRFFKKVSNIDEENIIRPQVRKAILNTFPYSLLKVFG